FFPQKEDFFPQKEDFFPQKEDFFPQKEDFFPQAASEQAAEQVKPSKSMGLPVLQQTAQSQSPDESRDPVCGMSVVRENARYKTVFGDETFYFCCLRCKETFDRSPQNYLETAGA
ncbi:MAG: YHS domain-containing protein, partial [Blastocatellia bacterium]|nr:YHS domain-containing protein [Blastocatellia bacterium]